MILNENLFEYIEELKEDFSTKLPTWITKNKDIVKALNRHNIDLAHATYIPAPIPVDGHDEVFKEARYLRVYRISEGDGSYGQRYPKLWIEGINDDMSIDLEDEGRYRAIKNISKRKLLTHVIEFGYIDLANSDNTKAMITKERARAKEGAINFNRETHAQFARKEVLGFDSKFNHIFGKTLDWLTRTGYDKSGYPLNPDKYKKVLDNVGLKGYEARLERYYNRIEKIRIQVINILSNINIKSKDRKDSDRIYYITKYFTNVLDTYTDILKEIDSIINHPKYNDVDKEAEISCIFQDQGWGPTIGKLRKDLEKAEEEIKAIEDHFINVPKQTVEENIIPDTEEDWITIQEDLDESLELNEFAAALMTGIGTSIGAGLVGALQKILNKEPKAKKSKWIDYKDYLIEKTPEKEFNVYDSHGNLIKDNLHTIKAAKHFIKDLFNNTNVDSDTNEFDKIAEEVGLTEEVDLEEFRKNELLEGESELDAIKRYKQELIECGVMNEGAMKDIAQEVEEAGGKDAWFQEMSRKISEMQDMLSYLKNQAPREMNRGGSFDSYEEIQEAIDEITQALNELETKCSIINAA